MQEEGAKKNRTEGDGEATLFLRRSCPAATSESPPPPPRLPARPRRPRGTHASRHSCKQGSATPVNSSGSADIGRDGSKASSFRWLGRRGIPTTAKLYLVLAATSLVVYVNGVVGDYVHDDLSAVVGNPDVQGTTPLWRLLVNDFWGRPMADPASHKSYRPLTILSFRFTHWLWSHSALADHLVNIALHVGVTVLYARTLLSALRLSLAQTLISGLAFATHPVHTEATHKPAPLKLDPTAQVQKGNPSNHRRLNHPPEMPGRSKDVLLPSSSARHVWDRTGLNTVMPLSRRIARMMLLGLSVVFLRLLLMRAAPVFSDQDNPASFAKSRFTR
ncbi:protein O-mannosyl-transferase TMTC1-like [Penaeus monodon]|uniref:protein O-mannosyl-transferase TMTC1-like n=1 Tax=Penaeus monodon TaxID=6687 RepID=UPI0018A7A062|nr:protein O-mannosyl-transferase TMTC1-like [Penaeus monodon]